ncbi:MAG: MucB/RseB C-terminal domain-containing protein [Burkholderiaceae bacterium]|nr:MucB/RseB C-terminal domain-containing protein [Burkholderiaceae bacterium]
MIKAVQADTGLALSLRLHRLGWYCMMVLVAGWFTPAVYAATADAEPDAGWVLLQKVQNAARTLDYSGVYTYQQGAVMQSSRVTHLVDGTGERERIEALDGAPREFLRQNDRIQCLIPERKLVILERRRGDRFPALLLGDGAGIAGHYQIHTMASPDRVAGHDCTVIEVTPQDKHRYGYRLCLDPKSHLLLKAQTLSADDVVIDQVVFNSLVIGDKVLASDLDSAWSTRDWKVLEASKVTIDLAKKGWRIPHPSGFQTISQVSRSLRAGLQVSQLVMADGLAAISVFIEPIDVATESKVVQGVMQKGAMNVFRARIGDYWMTALGEVPAATLRDMVQQAEYVPLSVHDQ